MKTNSLWLVALCIILLACSTTGSGEKKIESESLISDNPTSCTNNVSIFNHHMKGKITSQARSAYQYFLTSSDPAAGSTYTERMANFNSEISKTFQAFMSARRAEYRLTRCYYESGIQANAGKTKTGSVIAQPGFIFLTQTINRTTSGEWKGGPYYAPNDIEPTSFTWVTGGNRTSKTFVNILAKYQEEYIKKSILSELSTAKEELNDLGIPVDIPPFLND